MPRVRATQNEGSAQTAVSQALDNSSTNTGSDFLNGILDFFDFSGSRASAKANAIQAALQDDAQLFNRQEAAAARQWELMMSNTAHQREVADLKAAGLNPWLSAGNGAAAQTAASASSSTGGSSMANNKAAGVVGMLIAIAAKMLMS